MEFWNTTTTYPKDAIIQYDNKLYLSLKTANLDQAPDAVASTWWALHGDPITKVYDAIWTLLEANPRLAYMVKVGNRIKFGGADRDPIKAEVSDADLPELRLIPVGSTPHLQTTSNSSSLIKRFRLEVSTGDQRVDAGLFALEWEIYRALVGWTTTIMALTWNSKEYVKLARPVMSQDGISQADLTRGIKGWASIWEAEVQMWFSTADLS